MMITKDDIDDQIWTRLWERNRVLRDDDEIIASILKILDTKDKFSLDFSFFYLKRKMIYLEYPLQIRNFFIHRNIIKEHIIKIIKIR
jgi:hypothetical protein